MTWVGCTVVCVGCMMYDVWCMVYDAVGRMYGHVTLLPGPGQIEKDLEGIVLRGAPEGHVQAGLGPRLDGARRGWAVVDMEMRKRRGCFTPYIIWVFYWGGDVCSGAGLCSGGGEVDIEMGKRRLRCTN